MPGGLQDFSHQFPARQIVVRDENRHFGPLRPGSFPVAIFGESIDEDVVTAARQVIRVLDANYLGDSLRLRELIMSDVSETAAWRQNLV